MAITWSTDSADVLWVTIVSSNASFTVLTGVARFASVAHVSSTVIHSDTRVTE